MKEKKQSGIWADLLFWLAAVVLLFWALGQRGLWTAEGRWAEIVREMLINKSFFHPVINGEPYFDKPLLSYWLIIPVTFLTGMNEWALRIPSAICGLITLWATRFVGRKLWSEQTGRLAGWILLSTYGFLFWGRTGEADMANLAFIMMAVAWYWYRRDEPKFTTYLLFYIIMFVGAQMKGLTAVIIPILVIGPDLLVGKRWKHLLTTSHFTALILGALVYLIPFIYSSMTRDDYGSSGLYLVFRENIQRFFAPFDHKEPIWAYLEHVPVLFLPWSPILIIAAMAGMTVLKRLRDFSWHTLWLVCSIALIFAFFTASGSRRSYYILPILPFCALYVTRFLLSERFSDWKRGAIVFQNILLLLVTFLAFGAVVAFPHIVEQTGVPIPSSARYIVMWFAVFSLIPWLMYWKGQSVFNGALGLSVKLTPMVLTPVFFFACYFCAVQPLLESFRTEKQFGLEMKATGRTADETAFFQHHLENVVFYMDMTPPNHPVLEDSSAVYNFLQSRTNGVVILRRRSMEDMTRGIPSLMQGSAIVEEIIYPWEKEKKQGKKIIAWTLREEKSEKE